LETVTILKATLGRLLDDNLKLQQIFDIINHSKFDADDKIFKIKLLMKGENIND
jgi:hypothetical protein